MKTQVKTLLYGGRQAKNFLPVSETEDLCVAWIGRKKPQKARQKFKFLLSLEI